MSEIDWPAIWNKAWPIIVAFLGGTFIGNVKTLFEIRDIIERRRTKIVIHRSLVGHRDGDGNYVYITNLSPHVVLIPYWEIYQRKAWWDFEASDQIVVDSDGSPTKRIEPNEEILLSFTNEHWFNPWPKNLPNHTLYLRYMVTGEKRSREVQLSRR